MIVDVVTPPSGLVVSLEEAKLHLHEDRAEQDARITALIQAATQHLDGPRGWLGRALLTQTLELRTDRFPCCPHGFSLPYPRVQSVTSVTYVDDAGVTQTLAGSAWQLIKDDFSPRLQLAYGQSWPSARLWADAVKVRYVAGYGAAADVPESIKLAIKFFVEHFYEVTSPVDRASMDAFFAGLQWLLGPFRVW